MSYASQKMSRTAKSDLNLEERPSNYSPIPLSAIMDREGGILSPQMGDRMHARPPNSNKNSSSSSSSPDSGEFVQTLEDDHYSPTVLSPNRPKFAYQVSKTDTDSFRPNQESFKFQNDSFGSPTNHYQAEQKDDRGKVRPGIMKRNSRFSESRVRKTSKGSGSEPKEDRGRFSIYGDIYKEPMPIPKPEDSSPSGKGFFKKRMTLLLTPAQIEMIDDKVTKKYKLRRRERSLSASMDKGKVRRSKLLQRISNIAARGSISALEPDSPAYIFKQLLKKVNPSSLEKAEKDLKRRYIRRMRKYLKTVLRVPFQILTPDAFITIFWNFFILFIVIYDTFSKPFEVCFFYDDRTNWYIEKSDIICSICFTLDIVLNFRTAFYNKGVLVTEGGAIVKKYLTTTFSFDFIALCGDYVSFSYIEDGAWHLKLLCIVRLKKLMDLMTRTEDFFTLTRAMQASLKMLKLWGTIIIVAHWIACFFYLIAYNQLDSDVTWLHENGLIEASIVKRYIYAIYWAITTMVTVGYGDITPITVYERIYTILAMIIASALFGYSLNTVATIIKEISYEKNRRREKISSVKHYMNQKNLGKNIQTRVKNYIQYIIDSRALYKHDEEEFMGLLSQSLKDEIVSEVNGKILASSKIFSVNFSHKAALHLAKFMKEIFLAPEEVLFQEGERTDCSIYFIAYGKIQLYHKVKKFNVLEKGSHFGEVGFFSGGHRSTSAKSLFFSNLYSLARDSALENLMGTPSDFEMFHFIKDNININKNYSHIELVCFSCNEKGHLARDCGKIHYMPLKQEVIRDHLIEYYKFRRKYRRKRRSRFHALISIPSLSEAAEMMQEDYSDYTVSDEELSQDSLDIILERNLIIIPGVELNDLKARKVERRNKSNRYSAQALIGEIINANSAIATRFSYTSQNVTNTKDESKAGNPDVMFFTIDKVENFEVYYPQFNIRTLIQTFEKQRIQKMLQGSQGGIKTLVLKNFNSLLKETTRRGVLGGGSNNGSPLYFNSQVKPAVQRKRKTLDKSQDPISYSSLNKQMQQAIVRAKSLKRAKTKNLDDESEGNRSSDNNDKVVVDQVNGEEIDHSTFGKKLSTYDEATMSKKELHEERKTAKSKMQIEKLEILTPKTLTKIKLDNSDANLKSLRGLIESPTNSHKVTKKNNSTRSSKKGTIQAFHTRNSLDDKLNLDTGLPGNNMDNIIFQAMVREGFNRDEISTRRGKRNRAYSLEKLEDMKKAIHKFKIHRIIKTIVEASPVATKTANFGNL